LFAGHSENFSYVTQQFRLRGQTVYELTGAAEPAKSAAQARPAARVPGDA
jgi:chemotaxis protein methyltransferase CheR